MRDMPLICGYARICQEAFSKRLGGPAQKQPASPSPRVKLRHAPKRLLLTISEHIPILPASPLRAPLFDIVNRNAAVGSFSLPHEMGESLPGGGTRTELAAGHGARRSFPAALGIRRQRFMGLNFEKRISSRNLLSKQPVGRNAYV